MRYFNKDTGKNGKGYEKVTGDAMCTELGPGKPHLENWVLSKSDSGGAKDEL